MTDPTPIPLKCEPMEQPGWWACFRSIFVGPNIAAAIKAREAAR
jgi:hypothetical protein